MLLCCSCARTSRESAVGPPPQAEVAQIGALRVAMRPRATAGLVRVSLWIDAGSRDGAPSSLATLAAWSAESPEAPALVTPDATLFEARCETDSLAECLAPLGAAMAVRGVDAQRHAALRARLREDRLRALADSARRAEVLAIARALDDPAVDPLGAQSDDDALTIDAVVSFLAAHYGVERALLVLQGELPTDAAHVVRTISARWPHAAQPRGTRTPAPSGARHAAETASRTNLSIAGLFSSASEGARAATVLEGARVFGLRGGTVVLGSASLDSLTHQIHQLSTVTPSVDEPARTSSDPTEAIVARWLGAGTGSERSIGVGITCSEGRGHRTLQECEARVKERVDRGLEAANPIAESHGDASSADLRLTNGATVRVRRVPGPMGLVIRFMGGPSEEPPSVHGRSAIAAYALAQSCPAGVRPFVEAEGWGLAFEGDASSLEDVLRCALGQPTARDLANAQERVRATARRRPQRAWAGRLIAPSSPGLVAPEGSDAGAASVLRAESFLDEGRTGHRLTVAIAGDVAAEATAERAARAIGGVKPGRAIEPRILEPAAVRIRGEAHDSARPRVVVAWSTPAKDASSATAARAFAAARARAFREEGLDVAGFDGGAGAGLTWAFVTVDMDEGTLPQLPSVVERSRGAAIDLEGMSRALRWATGDPRRAARRLARQGSLVPPTPAEEVVRSLSAAEASYAVGRREPGLGLGFQTE